MIWSRVPATRRRVGGRPVFDLDRDRPRQLERGVMRFRRQRDDQVEIVVLQIVDQCAAAARRAKARPRRAPTSTKGSRSPARTPAEATIDGCGQQLDARAASAIGERTAFMPQMNSSDRGVLAGASGPLSIRCTPNRASAARRPA